MLGFFIKIYSYENVECEANMTFKVFNQFFSAEKFRANLIFKFNAFKM